MPELPEVEVVRQSLAKNVTGKKIKNFLLTQVFIIHLIYQKNIIM